MSAVAQLTRAPPGTPPSRPLKCGRLGAARVDRRAPAEGLDEFCHAPPRRATLAAVRSDEARVCARRRSTAWPLPARGSRDTSAGPAGMPAHATSAAYSAAGYAPACLFVSASPNPAASVCHGSTREFPHDRSLLLALSWRREEKPAGLHRRMHGPTGDAMLFARNVGDSERWRIATRSL